MTPLKITFNLATPFVKSGYPIHLDSLVGFCFQRHYLPLEDEPDEAAIMTILADLPFEKHEQDEDWVFKASALMPDAPMVHGSRFFTRRYSEMETAQAAVRGDIVYGKLKPGKTLAPHALKIDTKRGSQKNILAYHPTTECRRLVAYCIGDKELLDEALNECGHISHIGAKRRMGHGLIQSISIEDDDTALTAWQKRTMPWPLCDDVVPMRCTTQNPYFDKTKVKDGYCHIDAI